MRILLQDLKYGARMLLKGPVVSVVAALSLALGIAGATAMFALASGFFLQPLPFPDQDSMILVEQLQRGRSVEETDGVSMPNVRDLRESATTLRSLAAYTTPVVNITGGDQPERIRLIVGTPNTLDVLGVAPWMGRSFEPADGPTGAGRVLILTHGFWQSRFLSDPGVLGKAVQIDGVPYTVVGVMPEDFEMIPANVDAFSASDFEDRTDRADRSFLVLGRLRPGTSVEQARAELTAAYDRTDGGNAEANRNFDLLVRPTRDWFPGPTDTKLIGLLILVALFGLAIASANVANLLLGRAEERTKEMAVRTALGAGRARVLRQLLTESVLLALIGGAIGIALSFYVVQWLRLAMPPELPKSFMPALDGPTLAATVLLAMMAGVLFGLAPALQATSGNLRESLVESSRGGTAGRRRKRLRSAFVVSEIAVALALLTGAAFLLRAMGEVVNGDPGFVSDGLVAFETTLPEYRYAESADLARFEERAERALARIPGVEAVATMSSLPRSRGNPTTRFHVAGTPVLEENEQPVVSWQAVNASYFETLRIPLRQGHTLTASDRAGTAPVLVVSADFARRFLPPDGALGAQVEVLGETREVVGVVGDIKQSRISEDGQVEASIYLPVGQHPGRGPAWAVRASVDAATLGPALRAAIASVDPDIPIGELQTLDESIRQSLAGPRAVATFVLFLGALAMVLAAIGIYGVMSHNVTQTRREIGIRMAMGAHPRRVVGMITKRGASMAGLGMLLGLGPALLVRRGVLATLNLFDVPLSADYAILAGLSLATVAVVASLIPALRAARVPPVTALLDE